MPIMYILSTAYDIHVLYRLHVHIVQYTPTLQRLGACMWSIAYTVHVGNEAVEQTGGKGHS